MKKMIFVFILFITMFSFLSAENGEYEKESISSIETIWLNPKIDDKIHFEKDFYNVMFDHYVKANRYKYSFLPTFMTEDFNREIVDISSFSIKAVCGIFEDSVIKKTEEIINNPNKAKELNFTAEQVENFGNLSYLYFPFISKLTQKRSAENLINVKIKGGIVWHKIVVEADGFVDIKKIKTITSVGTGLASKSETFEFGDFKQTVGAEKVAQFQAIQALMRNLGVKSKKIADFKLSSQIVKTKDGSFVPIGFKEGVHLDDGFDLVEFVPRKNGTIKTKRIGFVRICKTGDNIKSDGELSKLKQYSGRKIKEGTFLQERPRIGIDFKLKANYLSNFNIPQKFSRIEVLGKNVLMEDVTTSVGGSFGLSYNIAPLVGITQTFFDVEFSYGQTDLKQNSVAKSANGGIYSLYFGNSKKFSFKRSILACGINYGYDLFSLTGKYSQSEAKHDYNFQYGVLAFKGNLAYELMINPDLFINLGIGYRYGFQPYEASLKIDDEEKWLYSKEEISENFPDINLNGLSLNIGISYSLSVFKYNTFAASDGLKRY